MIGNPIFIQRCFQLAAKGEGFTKPNPMVGAVIVHNDRIIGEGNHRRFGEAHAEVNAVNSVKDQSLLKDSTLYVSLEPCVHYGKTPPCAELIVSKGIPRVVIAVRDPNPNVSGKGVAMMRESGIEVIEGMLEDEARGLNSFFFLNQLESRPYVILKWAQSKDGFIDINRSANDDKTPVLISNRLTQSIVHKIRTRVQGIMVGTNTALLDNPQLTSRKWFGTNPTRITIDRENRIPKDSALFDGSAPVIIFTDSAPADNTDMIKFIELDFEGDTNSQILKHLYDEKIFSLMVEGGTKLLTSFIEKDLWDEVYVELSDTLLFDGVRAPDIMGHAEGTKKLLNSTQYHLKRKITRNFL